MIKLKRIYDPYEENDGYRILVDRLWPRGISKDDAKIDEWIKDIAPSNQIRKWFSHDVSKWPEFKRLYFEELKTLNSLVNNLTKKQMYNTITFLYAAKDEEHNNAVALKEYLELRE